MARTKSKNSKAELLVFSYLRRNGIYFQRHYKRVPGCPDIALPRKKRAVFIDGDFWHGRDYERRKRQLAPYWLNKVINNMARDRKVESDLSALDWRFIRVWESDIMPKSKRLNTLEQIKTFLLNQK